MEGRGECAREEKSVCVCGRRGEGTVCLELTLIYLQLVVIRLEDLKLRIVCSSDSKIVLSPVSDSHTTPSPVVAVVGAGRLPFHTSAPTTDWLGENVSHERETYRSHLFRET